MTASLPSSPARIRGTTEEQLQMMSSEAAPPSTNDDDNDTVLESLASVDEDENDSESRNHLITEIEEPWRTIAAPPAIRRRRKPSHDGEASRSLSFMETDIDMNGGLSIQKEQTMTFSQRRTRSSGLTATPTCRALCFLIVSFLVLCALLSHYTTSSDSLTEDLPQNTEILLSEQHILLKAYLGDLEGHPSTSNVKLPAGGNPIDLIHLLHSSTNTKEHDGGEECISTAPKQDVCLTIVVIVLCTIMAVMDGKEENAKHHR